MGRNKRTSSDKGKAGSPSKRKNAPAPQKPPARPAAAASPAPESASNAPGPAKRTGFDPARFPVVALGASAGGLSALEAFFENVPPDSGIAFVVVTHQAPDRTTLLTE